MQETNQEWDEYLSSLSKEELKAENELAEAVASEEFFNQKTGKLWVEKATGVINRITKEVTSDKYRKDHNGYVNAIADLQAHKKMLLRFQLMANPEYRERIRLKLESYQEKS